MMAFAGNSLLCRVALTQTGIDAASFTTIRLISGAVMLWLVVRMNRHTHTGRGNWLSALALFVYAAGFSFAYVSLPKGAGPFPTLIYLPPYQSVVGVMPLGEANEKRGRFITVALAARGQRQADKPYAAPFPGMLTAGIDESQTYIYRGIVADCCRAVDYLLTRPEVDRSRIAAVVANDLPLLTAALRPEPCSAGGHLAP